MKSLQQFITEAKSPRGTRGYVALMRCRNNTVDVAHISYDPNPLRAVGALTADRRKKYAEVIEGPRTLTLKGYKWYYDDYLGYKYAYGDNGYMAGNYDRDRWTPEEAWEILCDPKKKYTKEV